MRTFRVGVLAALFSAGALSESWSRGSDWQSFRSEQFGYNLLYPASVFEPRGKAPKGDGFEFISRDGEAKLKVFADYNADNVGLVEYRASIVRDLSGYDQLVYGPMGQSWFVLSGMRGGSIYYQKVLFSCGGRVINAFALTYPREQKREYDSIVTGIEKSFRSSSGPACNAVQQ
jgi:hypothetical protein